MKRYKYSKWFQKIMDKIPFGIIRVVVLVFLIIYSVICDLFRGIAAIISENMNGADLKSVFKDVWNWREWGDSQNGKYN